jgi:pimeloyl-ACP methyl ester carboxylesterase
MQKPPLTLLHTGPRGGRIGLAACAAVLVLAACSNSTTPRASEPTSAAPTSAPSSSATVDPDADPAARCGSKRAQSMLHQLIGPGGARLPVIDLGQASTVAVFLHQTDGDGLCGWWPFAVWATDRFHFRAVLVDLCGYGKAQCPPGTFTDDQKAQVALAVQRARTATTRRVVLVGASMGGALAIGSATAVHADAVVDLSGPADWTHSEAAPAARQLRVPCLVAVSPGDSDASYTALKAAFDTITASPKKFVPGDGAHGWDLLTDPTRLTPTWRPLATTVARWITGNYS